MEFPLQLTFLSAPSLIYLLVRRLRGHALTNTASAIMSLA